MNLFEAIKNGNYIKRKSSSTWLKVEDLKPKEDGIAHRVFTNIEIFADDWEIQQKEYMFTKSELYELLSDTMKLHGYYNGYIQNSTEEYSFVHCFSKVLQNKGIE